MRPLWVLAVCLVVAVAATSTQAQPPPPSFTPSITVAVQEDTGTVTVERATTFNVVVKNAGSSSGTPLDEQNKGEVTMRLEGVPDGWTASITPAAFDLAPGKSLTVSLSVLASASSSTAKHTITVIADMATPLEGLDPILGSVPGASQMSSGRDAIELHVDNSVTRNVLEAVGPWIYVLILALVAAVLVAVGITVASRRVLVRLATDRPELNIPPGGRVAFPLRVESLAKEDDQVILQVSAVAEGWAAFLPVPELAMVPAQVEDITLVVIAPVNAPPGTRQAILVSATSAKAARRAANVEFVAVVQGAPARTPPPFARASPEPAVAPKRRK